MNKLNKIAPDFDLRNSWPDIYKLYSMDFTPCILDSHQYKMQVHILTDDSGYSCIFLEHVFDRKLQKATKEIITLKYPNTLVVSQDLGETWTKHPVHIEPEEEIRNCFTLLNGSHLLVCWNSKQLGFPATRLILLNKDYSPNSSVVFPRTAFAWLGSWAIDQSADGTIMFGEYIVDEVTEYASVYRSNDGGHSWEAVLTLPRLASSDEPNKIRHFHTCQADPFMPGRWYATTGDDDLLCNLFVSEDNGASWQLAEHQEITFRGDVSEKDKVLMQKELFRTTTTFITEDSLWFIHDVNSHKPSMAIDVQPQSPKAGLIARLLNQKQPQAPEKETILKSENNLYPYFMRCSKFPPYNIEFICKVGISAVRSMIKYGDDKFVAITEDKLQEGGMDVFLGSLKSRNIAFLGKVPNYKGVSNPGTASRSSIASFGNVLFTHLGKGFKKTTCLLKININELDNEKNGASEVSVAPEQTQSPVGSGAHPSADFFSRSFDEIYSRYFTAAFSFNKKAVLVVSSDEATPQLPQAFAKSVVTCLPLSEINLAEGNQYHYIYFPYGLEELNDDRQAIAKLHSSLKDEGVLFLHTDERLGETLTNEVGSKTKRVYGDLDILRLLQQFFLSSNCSIPDDGMLSRINWHIGIKTKIWSGER